MEVFGLVLVIGLEVIIIVGVKIIHVLVHLRGLFVRVIDRLRPGADFIALVFEEQIVHDLIG